METNFRFSRHFSAGPRRARRQHPSPCPFDAVLAPDQAEAGKSAQRLAGDAAADAHAGAKVTLGRQGVARNEFPGVDRPLQLSPAFIDGLNARRRANGRFNNPPAADGSDGHVMNTRWGIQALRALGRADEKKKETVAWLQTCQLPNGGFMYQPRAEIGGLALSGSRGRP